MFGCLRRIGCGLLLLLAAAALWLTRDRWYPRIAGERTVERVEEPAAPISDSAAVAAEQAISRLARPGGPAYAHLTGAEVASLILREAARRNPLPLDSAVAGVTGDELWLRGALDIRELQNRDVLGPLGMLLGNTETVELRGTLHIVSPGLAEFRLRSVKLRDIALPSPAIRALLRQSRGAERPAGAAAQGLQFAVPAHIGDVRIGDGRVTLYRTLAPSASDR
ncbi:MAG: hypothetical protein ACT4R6_07335 [Gemmatimonadaceae bacterium]